MVLNNIRSIPSDERDIVEIKNRDGSFVINCDRQRNLITFVIRDHHELQENNGLSV